MGAMGASGTYSEMENHYLIWKGQPESWTHTTWDRVKTYQTFLRWKKKISQKHPWFQPWHLTEDGVICQTDIRILFKEVWTLNIIQHIRFWKRKAKSQFLSLGGTEGQKIKLPWLMWVLFSFRSITYLDGIWVYAVGRKKQLKQASRQNRTSL